MSKSAQYYNDHVDEFFLNTYQIDMQDLYRDFLTHLPPHARILDLGCGSGRDSLAFQQQGYQVDGIDASYEMVKKARALTALPIKLQSFYELDDIAVYDGIWACASLVHCERQRLVEVLHQLILALQPNGVLYMSFKYGALDRQQQGRAFTDLDEQHAQDLLDQCQAMALLQQWVSIDQRPHRSEQWLNLLWKKTH